MNLKFRAPLSDQELEEPDRFLLSDAKSDETMLLDTLDGYLTAIVIGPTTILPSQWLPGILGPSEDDEPQYESMEQAQRILELVMAAYERHHMDVAARPRYFLTRYSIQWSMRGIHASMWMAKCGRTVSWTESSYANRTGSRYLMTPPPLKLYAQFACRESMK
jgi:hypothetical protein